VSAALLRGLSGGVPTARPNFRARKNPALFATSDLSQCSFFLSPGQCNGSTEQSMLTNEASELVAAELDEELGEIIIADYLVFLFALDTYMRWVEELVDVSEDADEGDLDHVTSRGLSLLRTADRVALAELDKQFRSASLQPMQLKMLDVALRQRPSAKGAAIRALRIRSILTRSMAATTKAIFGQVSAARKRVLDAIEASLMKESEEALTKLASINLRNAKLEAWIDLASKTAGSGLVPLNPVNAASKVVDDAKETLNQAAVAHDAANPASEEAQKQTAKREEALTDIENSAADAARKAIAKSGQEDRPVTKSEAVGIATAAVAATTRDVPESLKGLDPEQLAAATTMGRVLVAASAGSGKTSTLVKRLAWLVQSKKVNPSRIMAVTFNKKAQREIKERLAAVVGDDAVRSMSIGTMHSIFRSYITQYGTEEEKAALTTWMMEGGREAGQSRRAPSPAAMGGSMARAWKECKGSDPPRKATNRIQKWQMNDLTPSQVVAKYGPSPEAEWYEWNLGYRGVIKGWTPPCSSSFKAMKEWNGFLSKYRDGGRARLGTFSDMIIMFRDILKRNPALRKKIQSDFDHINVDEAQDLNEVQHQIFDMLTEHVSADSKDKSAFLIGDEKQAINGYVGARPDLFTGVAKKEGFQVKSISTNYRCLPEIIEMANRLMDNHPKDLPVEARPDPAKPRGSASIVVSEPADHTQGAISTVDEIAQAVAAGGDISDHAVLTRTNAEINDFETACIMKGLPYARRGSSSFIRARETVTVMSYVNLSVGQDFEKMQRALAAIFNTPNRFFLRAGESERIVDSVITKRARSLGVSKNQVNPLDTFDDDGIRDYLETMDPDRRWERWKVQATREQLEAFGRSLYGLRDSVSAGVIVNDDGSSRPYKTDDLIKDILTIPGVPERGKEPPTLREVLMGGPGATQEEEGDNPEEDTNQPPIGNVAFLFQICQSKPGEPDDPGKPENFLAKVGQLAEKSKDLRVNLDEWDQEQQKLDPSERKPAPCVVLSTIHSCKGAQWPDVTVVMADGVFPFFATVPGAGVASEDPSPRNQEIRSEFLTERQLAYVAFTRAGKNLTVLSPKVNAYGKAAKDTPLFVQEAGLVLGQNVPGKNNPMPSGSTVQTEPVAAPAVEGELEGPSEEYAEEMGRTAYDTF
jgi:superfamily I DNA/RNA helicase